MIYSNYLPSPLLVALLPCTILGPALLLHLDLAKVEPREQHKLQELEVNIKGRMVHSTEFDETHLLRFMNKFNEHENICIKLTSDSKFDFKFIKQQKK